MAPKRTIGLALIISVAADGTGLGRDPGFGHQQTAGTAAGAIVAIAGAILMRRK